MNTDIRIDWHSGMEITPQTFIDMENDIAENRMLLRKILATKAFGVIPKTTFILTQEITGNTMQVKQIDCSLLLPAGEVVVLQSDTPFNVEIPVKEAKELYLTVEMGDREFNFVKAGIPHVSVEYKFDFKALTEIKDAIPLLKIVNEGGAWTVYNKYLRPVIAIRTLTALLSRYEELKPLIRKITEHEKICFMDGRVLVQVMADQLLAFPVDESPRELILLCKRFMSALGHAIYEPLAQESDPKSGETEEPMRPKPEMPVANLNDIEPFLNAFVHFIDEASVAMNYLKAKVVEVVPPPEEPEEPKVEEEDVFMPII